MPICRKLTGPRRPRMAADRPCWSWTLKRSHIVITNDIPFSLDNDSVALPQCPSIKDMIGCYETVFNGMRNTQDRPQVMACIFGHRENKVKIETKFTTRLTSELWFYICDHIPNHIAAKELKIFVVPLVVIKPGRLSLICQKDTSKLPLARAASSAEIRSSQRWDPCISISTSVKTHVNGTPSLVASKYSSFRGKKFCEVHTESGKSCVVGAVKLGNDHIRLPLTMDDENIPRHVSITPVKNSLISFLYNPYGNRSIQWSIHHIPILYSGTPLFIPAYRSVSWTYENRYSAPLFVQLTALVTSLDDMPDLGVEDTRWEHGCNVRLLLTNNTQKNMVLKPGTCVGRAIFFLEPKAGLKNKIKRLCGMSDSLELPGKIPFCLSSLPDMTLTSEMYVSKMLL
nr:MAG: protein LF2 [Peromyscus leucopus gammaherpesvirus]